MHTLGRRLLVGLSSIIITMLLVRVATMLMAPDPAHPFIQILRWLTDPLLEPIAWIDATQPMVGSRFERGPLLLAGALVLITVIGLRATRKEAPHGRLF